MSYKVEVSSKVIKDMKSVPKTYQIKIIEKAESLADDPYPKGCLKLKGLKEELWRVRVGDYRILYQVDEEVRIIDIRKVGHRKNIY